MLLSIIIPVYYNEKSLPILYERLNKVSGEIKDVDFEYVFVDDGSGDNSYNVLHGIAKNDTCVKVVKLSRNFGSFVACLAGLTYCKGDCAVIMAADLQDPPELINELLYKWKQGNEIVYAVREKREESGIKVFFSKLYYRIFKLIALSNMPKGGFDFVLLGRKVIDAIVKAREKNSTLIGQILWVGFKSDYILYTKKAREHGKSRWTLRKKIKYFLDSILAFSFFPIRIISAFGILVAFCAFSFGLYTIFLRIFLGVEVKGFTTLIVVILFTSGIQMIMLGIVGEYLWRTLEETRNRPNFVVDQLIGFEESLK